MSEFLFREALDEGFRDGGVGDEDGLEFRAKGGFDRAGGGVVGLDERGEHAIDRGLELVGGVEAFEEVLRAFCKAFAGSDELLHGIEAGGALGEDLVGIRGGGAGGIEIAAGVLVGALGRLESLLQLGELCTGFGDERGDVGLLGDVLLDSEVQALLLFGELAGAFAVAFELGERGFDFRLHRGNEVLAGVRLAA